MSRLHATQLVLRCRRRIAVRRLRERAFELLVLGPLVLGALAWVSARYLDLLRPVVAGWLDVPPSPVASPALLLALALAPVLWPGSLRELYGHQPLDTLPVPEVSRVALTLVAGAGRSLWPALPLLAALWVLAGRPPRAPEVAAVVGGCVLLSWLGTALAILLVHLGAVSVEWLLSLATVAALVVLGPWAAGRWLLLPWGVAGGALHGAFSSSLGLFTPRCVSSDGLFLATLAAVAGVLGGLHLAWRRRDLETYRNRRQRRRRAEGFLVATLARLVPRRAPAPLRSLVRRDLRLVARRFSPAVHLCAGLALAAVGVMIALGLDADLRLPDAWRRQAMVAASALSVLVSVALVPFLLRLQLPAFWLEKVTGVPLEQVWQAKVWLSLLLAIPGTAAGVSILAVLGPGTGGERAVAAFQLLAASLIVASLVGLACFEIATEPLIGVVWSGALALALSSLFLFYPKASALWILAYLWAASEVAKRATRRVRFTEVMR